MGQRATGAAATWAVGYSGYPATGAADFRGKPATGAADHRDAFFKEFLRKKIALNLHLISVRKSRSCHDEQILHNLTTSLHRKK